MILVATGTHHQPFERLVRAAEGIAATKAEPVVLQRGTARSPAPHCIDHRYLHVDRFEELLRAARIVVLHAGSSSFLQARAFGRVPILVPRRPDRGEHVDMHQIQFARSVASEARVVEPEDLAVAVAEHLDPRTIVDPERRSRAFAVRLSEVMADLLGPPQ